MELPAAIWYQRRMRRLEFFFDCSSPFGDDRLELVQAALGKR